MSDKIVTAEYVKKLHLFLKENKISLAFLKSIISKCHDIYDLRNVSKKYAESFFSPEIDQEEIKNANFLQCLRSSSLICDHLGAMLFSITLPFRMVYSPQFEPISSSAYFTSIN